MHTMPKEFEPYTKNLDIIGYYSSNVITSRRAFIWAVLSKLGGVINYILLIAPLKNKISLLITWYQK